MVDVVFSTSQEQVDKINITFHGGPCREYFPYTVCMAGTNLWHLKRNLQCFQKILFIDADVDR